MKKRFKYLNFDNKVLSINIEKSWPNFTFIPFLDNKVNYKQNERQIEYLNYFLPLDNRTKDKPI